MNAHTKGPWHEAFTSDKTWHKGIYDADGNEVAIVKVKSAMVARRKDADARLIAAAPELLEALKELTIGVENIGGEHVTGLAGLDQRMTAAYAAIAKALGEQQ